jgi:hypothetical protein
MIANLLAAKSLRRREALTGSDDGANHLDTLRTADLGCCYSPKATTPASSSRTDM